MKYSREGLNEKKSIEGVFRDLGGVLTSEVCLRKHEVQI